MKIIKVISVCVIPLVIAVTSQETYAGPKAVKRAKAKSAEAEQVRRLAVPRVLAGKQPHRAGLFSRLAKRGRLQKTARPRFSAFRVSKRSGSAKTHVIVGLAVATLAAVAGYYGVTGSMLPPDSVTPLGVEDTVRYFSDPSGPKEAAFQKARLFGIASVVTGFVYFAFLINAAEIASLEGRGSSDYRRKN